VLHASSDRRAARQFKRPPPTRGREQPVRPCERLSSPGRAPAGAGARPCFGTSSSMRYSMVVGRSAPAPLSRPAAGGRRPCPSRAWAGSRS
jgi:hypothetical protein